METPSQRGTLRADPVNKRETGPMLGRLACSMGLHRVITRSDKPKSGVPPRVLIRGFCYRPGCKFEFKRLMTLDSHDV